MKERKNNIWINLKTQIEEIIAYGIRTELTNKTSDELLDILDQQTLISLRKSLVEQELTRRGIAIQALNENHVERLGQTECGLEAAHISRQSTSRDLTESKAENVKKSYLLVHIKRHWRGEFELLESFWGNVVVINVILIVLITLLFSSDSFTQFSDQHTKTAWSVSLIATLALYPIAVWQLVGVWRSATNHIKMTGLKFWPRVSKIIVILSIIGTFNQSFYNALIYIDSAKIVFGYESFDKYRITVSEDVTTIEINGGIGFQLAEKVADELTVNPDINTIHLNSYGGRLDEAHRLRTLIAQKGLTTYASERCYSACAIAFLGGRERILHKDAKLGFHQPSILLQQTSLDSSNKKNDIRNVNKLIKKEKQMLLEAGITPLFVEKVMSTPSDEMWYPKHERLLKEGIISRITEES